MCLFYGLYLWWTKGGRLAIIFQPFPHIVVFSATGVWHGTNRSGRWRIEKMSNEAVIKWLDLHQKASSRRFKEWTGCGCPVPETDLVTVYRRDGNLVTDLASRINWYMPDQTTYVIRWMHGDLDGNIQPTGLPDQDGWVSQYCGMPDPVPPNQSVTGLEVRDWGGQRVILPATSTLPHHWCDWRYVTEPTMAFYERSFTRDRLMRNGCPPLYVELTREKAATITLILAKHM